MRLERFVLCALLAQNVLACGDGGKAAPERDGGEAAPERDSGEPMGQVEIYSWWVFPGEVEALQTVMDLNKQRHPEVNVFNAALGTLEEARAELEQRLMAGNPPDLFQDSVVTLPGRLQAYPGKFEPLDDLFDQTGLRDSVPEEIIDALTIDGHIYGIPVNVHRLHVLYTNSSVFAANQVVPPDTSAELLELCATLKAKGTTPIAAWGGARGVDGLFHALSWSALGAETYADYFTGKLPADNPALTAAIDYFATVYDQYTNPGSHDPAFTYLEAQQLLFNGQAAMRFEGDWTTGYYRQLGWEPGVDFDVQGPPGAEEGFEYVIDVFVLPMDARNKAAARQFLETFVSTEGQIAFNNIKGSSPVRTDVDPNKLVPIVRLGLENFTNAKVYTSYRSREEWFPAFEAFQKDDDKAKLRAALLEYPPLP